MCPCTRMLSGPWRARSWTALSTDEVLEAVCQGVDGNPLFLEERLASLLDTGALERDDAGWRLASADANAVPEVLERLIRSRTDRLSPAAREAIVAASVLGDEAERSAIGAVCELDGALDAALSELVSGGLLTEARSQPEPLYRFHHALIRDATYHGLLRSQRRQLHARAAWYLEVNVPPSASPRSPPSSAITSRPRARTTAPSTTSSWPGTTPTRSSPTRRPSLCTGWRSPSSSGDRVANGEAPPPGAWERAVTAARLCEKLTDLLLFIDRFEEARSAGLAGLALVRPEDRQQAARLHYLLGKIEFQQAHFDSALAAFAAAEELIGAPGLDDDQEWVELWLVLQLDEKFDIYDQRQGGRTLRRPHRERSPAGGGERRGPRWHGVLWGAGDCSTCVSAATGSTSRSSKSCGGCDEAAWGPERGTLGFMRPERGAVF